MLLAFSRHFMEIFWFISDYVCVMDLGLFELVLRLSDNEDKVFSAIYLFIILNLSLLIWNVRRIYFICAYLVYLLWCNCSVAI